MLFPRLTEDVSRFDISARKMTMRPLSTGHEERPGRVFIGLDVIGHLWSNNGREQKKKKKSIVDIVLRQSARVEEESKG